MKRGKELVHTAREIARAAHNIVHPSRVAGKFDNDILIATALLHDVIEDSDVTASDLIENGIPLSVVKAVMLLTKSGPSYLEYILKLKKNRIARQVKIEDIKDNLRTSEPSKQKSLRAKWELALYILEN